jgi:hypothetical protein
VAKIDVAEIDGDLLAVDRLRSQFASLTSHRLPSYYHLYGWYMESGSLTFKR